MGAFERERSFRNNSWRLSVYRSRAARGFLPSTKLVAANVGDDLVPGWLWLVRGVFGIRPRIRPVGEWILAHVPVCFAVARV